MIRRRDVLRGAAAAAALAACGARETTRRAGAARTDPNQEPAPVIRANKTILILGGTGFLGPHLVEAAVAAGHTVTLFNRGKTNPHLFPGLEKLRGDRDGDLGALEGRSWDAVIDTSGYVPRIVSMSAALLAPRVKHYLFISTISVYADFDTPGMDESAPRAALDDPGSEDVSAHYGALKALCEQAAEAAMPGQVANVRPGLIVGPGDNTDRFTYWPVRIARGGEVLAPNRPEDPVQYIDARDLAAWCVTVVENQTTGTFNALGPAAPLPVGTMLEEIRDGVGSDARFVWVEREFLEQHQVRGWVDLPVWLPPVEEYRGAGRMSNAAAVAAGLTFRPVADTARDTLGWWREQPAERRSQLRAGLSAEREAEVLAAWSARRPHRPG